MTLGSVQVNNYSEAIYTQALHKAAEFEDHFNQKLGLPSPSSDPVSYSKGPQNIQAAL